MNDNRQAGQQLINTMCIFVQFSLSFSRLGVAQATSGHAGVFRASLERHGCLLEASWDHRGVLLGAIWSLEMCIFTEVLQAFPLLDAFGDAQLQALAIRAS